MVVGDDCHDELERCGRSVSSIWELLVDWCLSRGEKGIWKKKQEAKDEGGKSEKGEEQMKLTFAFRLAPHRPILDGAANSLLSGS